MLEAIRSAQKSVTILADLQFRSGRHACLAAQEDAHQRGVVVCVLIDDVDRGIGCPDMVRKYEPRDSHCDLLPTASNDS